MDLPALFGAIVHIFAPWTFFMLFLGTSLGIVVGAIPGLSGAMLIALTLPLTFYMEPFDAVVLLISMYVGAISCGLVTATLMRMRTVFRMFPGETVGTTCIPFFITPNRTLIHCSLREEGWKMWW